MSDQLRVSPRARTAAPYWWQLAIMALVCLQPVAAGLAADLVIENVSVVSPQLAQPLPAQHVLIRDGRIVQVSGKPPGKSAARRLDGRGKFLTPGLMDSHVHVGIAAGLPPISDDIDVAALSAAYFRQQPRSYLYFGVTQVVDLGSFGPGAELFDAQPQHPDLFRCGAAIALDGYPSVFVDKPLRYSALPDYIYEPANAANPLPDGADPAAHTPEAVVARIAARGARCVKVFIENGFGPRADWPVLSAATLRRVREATRSHKLLLIAHANALDMQRIAIAAGVDVIAHGLWDWNDQATDTGMPGPVAAHLRTLQEMKIGFQPTLRVLPATADLFRDDTLKDPTYAKVVPPQVLAWYGTPAGQWHKRVLQREFSGASDASIAHTWIKLAEPGMRAVRHLHQHGHPLLLASDTPSAPTYGNQPGYDTYREMRLMAQAGVPLAAILQAGTLNNARQFGLERDYGSVEAGKIANLLLLEANPLETLRAWAQIDQVILHGEPIERESLAAR